MNKYLAIACVIMLMACASLLGLNRHLQQEKERLSGNQSALMSKVQFYQDKAGRSASSVQRLELTKSELEAYNQELTNVIDGLNVKLKRVQAVSTAATQTSLDIKTVIRDSIVYVDSGRIEKLPAIKWKDPWVNIDGLIKSDSTVELSVQSVDTLYQVVHRVPKRFLFFRWGAKAIRQEMVSSNPHTRIVYSEYIELAGKKR